MKLDDMGNVLRLFPDSNWLFPAATLQLGPATAGGYDGISAVLGFVEIRGRSSVAITVDPARRPSGGSREGTADGLFKIMPLTGRIETPALTITGGADVAEPFPVVWRRGVATRRSAHH